MVFPTNLLLESSLINKVNTGHLCHRSPSPGQQNVAGQAVIQMKSH